MNMSSSTNDSLTPQIISFNTSLFVDSISVYMYFIFTLTDILLILPPSIFVLYLGHQRWRQQRSVSTAAIISNSDFFTYNMAAIELIGLIGNVIGCFKFTELPVIIGLMTGAVVWSGQMLFPLVTCVDRYLAVVHPVTYLTLRQARGVRVRNIIAGSIWVQGFGGIGFAFFMKKYPQFSLIPASCYMVVCLIIMIFCSLSVLSVLIRPRPGEVGIDRLRVDKSKQRAFYTILIIMGVLLLRFGGNLVCYVISSSPTVSDSVKNVMIASALWFSLPSSLVLPLLFLHRAGKLPGCKHNTESG